MHALHDERNRPNPASFEANALNTAGGAADRELAATVTM
jgi:hypothetical protein